MLRGTVCTFLLSAAWLGAQRAPAPPGPEALVRAALERNRELIALRERVNEARGLLRQAGVRPAPAVEIETLTGRPLGSQGEQEFSAGISYSIETAGKRSRRQEVAGSGVELAQAELDDRVRELSFEIRSRYNDAGADQERAAVLSRLRDVSRDVLRLTEARIAEGDAAALERDLLATELNRSEAQRELFLGRAVAAVVELIALAGLDDGASVPVPGIAMPSGAPPALAELKSLAAARRPDLRIARLIERQGGAEIRLVQAEGRPDVTLAARYGHARTSFEQFGTDGAGRPVPIRDRDNTLAFGVSVPLFNSRRIQGSLEAATARAAAARLRRQHMERTIGLEVEAAWRRWDSARRTAGLLEGGVLGQAGKNLAVIRQAYELGQLRMLDVLNEQRRLIDIEMAYIDARAQVAQAAAELERAAGGRQW